MQINLKNKLQQYVTDYIITGKKPKEDSNIYFATIPVVKNKLTTITNTDTSLKSMLQNEIMLQEEKILTRAFSGGGFVHFQTYFQQLDKKITYMGYVQKKDNDTIVIGFTNI